MANAEADAVGHQTRTAHLIIGPRHHSNHTLSPSLPFQISGFPEVRALGP